MNELPTTLVGAVRYFSDLDICDEYMKRIKWADGKPICPKCGSDRIGELKSRRKLKCNVKACQKQFSHKLDTIFEDSPLGLDKWFVAVWCIANAKNGISSHELGRAIGVTQKTAWFMLHRIRKAMETGTFAKMDGPAEADTTYVGGKAANMHKHIRERKITGRGGTDKTAIHAVLQRGTEDTHSTLTASVIGSESAESLMAEVRRHVAYGANVFTDEATAYGPLALTHVHKAIDHSKCYVMGEVHTNGVENFWCLLKRSIRGTYVSVAPFHLYRYVAEQVFRFNNRQTSDAKRFALVMAQCVGRRLTWRTLCAVGDSGFMGLK
tara:strand:- start:5982 stop:6950 length:969 start_codon:yes stop_codon:yes gene_type:complete